MFPQHLKHRAVPHLLRPRHGRCPRFGVRLVDRRAARNQQLSQFLSPPAARDHVRLRLRATLQQSLDAVVFVTRRVLQRRIWIAENESDRTTFYFPRIIALPNPISIGL